MALTLRALGGLSTAEIARAFLVPEATMAKRLVRAKQRIRAAGIPFEVPSPSVRVERLGAVLVVQAAIAAAHARDDRDWCHIAVLYAELFGLTRSPIVTLNHSVAIAETEGPQAALDMIDRLLLSDYRYWHATRAELLYRLCRSGEACDAYRRAIPLVHNEAERRLYERRLLEIAAEPGLTNPKG